MAGEASLTKIKERMFTWLDGNIGSGVSLFLDRPFDQPFNESELNAVNIHFRNVGFVPFGHNSWQHIADLVFDIATESTTTSTIDEDQAQIAADIVARLSARTSAVGTIGELLQDAVPVSMTTESDDDRLADIGEASFAWRLTWLTPENDFKTVIGHNGNVS